MQLLCLFRTIPSAALLAFASATLAAVLLPAASHAASYNVSGIVTGTQTAEPLIWFGQPQLACDTACVYATSSSAGHSNSYTTIPGPFLTQAWPPAFTGAGGPPRPGSIDDTLAPAAAQAGVVQDGGPIGIYQRSLVSFSGSALNAPERRIATQTWKTGSGATVVSYAVRLTTPSTGARHTYLEFGVPELKRAGWQYAYYVNGPSGDQPIYTKPDRIQSRAAMDVYVDGLPVWSSESNMLHPRIWTPPGLSPDIVSWGSPMDASTTTLYLGYLNAGSTRTIAVVMRTDLRVEAPTCKFDSENGVSYQRCHSMRESMTLRSETYSSNGFVFYRPRMRVFTY